MWICYYFINLIYFQFIIMFPHWLCFVTSKLYCHLLDFRELLSRPKPQYHNLNGVSLGPSLCHQILWSLTDKGKKQRTNHTINITTLIQVIKHLIICYYWKIINEGWCGVASKKSKYDYGNLLFSWNSTSSFILRIPQQIVKTFNVVNSNRTLVTNISYYVGH